MSELTKLQKLLLNSNEPLKSISKHTGISYSTLRTYSKGTKIPGKKVSQRLADYFGVSVSDLLETADNIPESVTFTIKLPELNPDFLLARYKAQVQQAIEKAISDYEHYKPFVRMKGLCKWLGVSTTTVIKWQKDGMPHIVIDGVVLYNKHSVAKWLEQHTK